MADTKYWVCDVCHEKIERAEDRWVQWITQPYGKVGRDLRLVHHRPASPLPEGCQFDSQTEYTKDKGAIGDLPLTSFMGPSGLMRLMAFIADQVVPTEEVLEMIKRIHVPGYERVRFHLKEAANEEIFDPKFGPGIIIEPQIDLVIQWLDSKEEAA